MTPRDLFPPPEHDLLAGRVLPFRRTAVKPRRRRRSLPALLWKPLLGAFLLVATPVGVAAWMLTSPRFDLHSFEVRGTERVPARWVEGRLVPFRGHNLLLLSLDRVSAALVAHPWIARLEIDKHLPDGLRVVVHERRPVALVEERGDLFYADAGGRIIAPADRGETRGGGGDLVVVTRAERAPGGVGRALAVAAELGRVAPVWGAELERIDVLGDRDFGLHIAALPFPLLVRAGDVAPKVRRLDVLLPRLLAWQPPPAAVDLRFRRRIVVQPAIGLRGGARDAHG